MPISTFLFVVAVSLGLPLLTTGICRCSVTGYTWDFKENIDEVVIGVESVELCFKICQDVTECLGITWTHSVVPTCYLFKNQLQGYHECVECKSWTVQQTLDGACVSELILDYKRAYSFEECRLFCMDYGVCDGYTWWDNTTSFVNTCFLYGFDDCSELQPCDGCYSGRINCIFNKPDHCVEYMVLDDAKRSVNYIDEDDYCDDMNTSSTSYDWHGPGYYRIMSTAGTRLPESSPGRLHCGTLQSGWLWGKHHQAINAEKKMTVCFHSFYDDYDDCYRSDDITVTFCDGFYVYMLPNVPVCDSRYCVSN